MANDTQEEACDRVFAQSLFLMAKIAECSGRLLDSVVFGSGVYVLVPTQEVEKLRELHEKLQALKI
jgi:hypothetical protein